VKVPVSRRAETIQTSVTLALSARAKALQAEGKDVLNLTAGEPDFDTPEPIVEAAHRALREKHFKYTPTAGVRALREQVAVEYTQRLSITIEPDMTLVTNGAKHALFNALTTVTDPGDRIGVLRPYWVTYAEQAHALGCEPVMIPCPRERGFRPDLDALRRELTRGLAVVVINSPCNPTGASFSAEEWHALLDVIEPFDTRIVSDEIYEDIVYTSEGHHSPVRLRPDLASRVCVVTGLSKTFAMTGWRVGFSIAPREWTAAMIRLQDHVTSNVNAVAQQAAIVALQRRELVRPMVEEFRRRRDVVVARCQEVAGLHASSPEGTFYLYTDVSDHLGPGRTAAAVDELAARLLDEHLLAVIPGSAFGDPQRLRLSFAASSKVLDGAFDRLENALGHA
jgi:aspartate aminotransferase